MGLMEVAIIGWLPSHGEWVPPPAYWILLSIIVALCFVTHLVHLLRARRRQAGGYPGVPLGAFWAWHEADIRAKTVFFLVLWGWPVGLFLIVTLGALLPSLWSPVPVVMSVLLTLYGLLFWVFLAWAGWLGIKASHLRKDTGIGRAVKEAKQGRTQDEAAPSPPKPEQPGSMSTEEAVQSAKQALRDGRPAEAVRLLQAFNGTATNIEALTTLGVAYAQMGQLESAEETLRHAIEFQPKSAAIHYNLALVLYRAGKYPAAWGEIHTCQSCGYDVPGQFLVQLSAAMPEPE